MTVKKAVKKEADVAKAPVASVLDDLLAAMLTEIQFLNMGAGVNTDKLQGLYDELVTALRAKEKS